MKLSGQLGFAVAISLAASTGLIKTVLLAFIMDAASFGQFATLTGAAIVVATVSSVGTIEQTVKYYPRAWAAKEFAELARHFRETGRKMFVRTALIALLLAALLIFGGVYAEADPATIALATTLIVSNAQVLLVASMFRAIGAAHLILIFTFLRGGFSALVTVPLALKFDWPIVVLGEALAMAFLAIGSAIVLRRRVNAALPHSIEGTTHIGARESGRQLYVSNVAQGLVPFGGRGFINWLADPRVAGYYAFNMIAVQVAQMFAGAVAQKEGPATIKRAAAGQTSLLRPMALPFAMVFALATAALAVFLITAEIPVFAELWDRYALSPWLMAISAVAMAGSISLLLQFVLIAIDEEASIVRSSLLAVIVVYGGFVLSHTLGAGIAGFMAAVAAGEWIKSLYLLRRYFTARQNWSPDHPVRHEAD